MLRCVMEGSGNGRDGGTQEGSNNGMVGNYEGMKERAGESERD